MPTSRNSRHRALIRRGATTAALCGVLAVVGGIGGCGGSNHHTTTQRTDRHAAPRLTGDDLAYLAIARASGTVRANVAATALGRARRISDLAAMRAAATTVAHLRPSASSLIAAQRSIATALTQALSAGPNRGAQRAAAASALHTTDDVNAKLRLYAAAHPVVQTLVPD